MPSSTVFPKIEANSLLARKIPDKLNFSEFAKKIVENRDLETHSRGPKSTPDDRKTAPRWVLFFVCSNAAKTPDSAW
jgi:hypothetical protein